MVDDLVTANHILAMHGILDTYGHVSIRSPDNSQRYLMARLQSAARSSTAIRRPIFSIANVPLRPVARMSSFLWVGVPVFEIRDVAAITDLLVRSPALGKALAATLGDKPMALMRGHGSVIVGGDLPTAVFRAIYSEENARMEAAALSLGGPVNYISAEESALRDKAPEDPRRAWNLWKSQLGDRVPRRAVSLAHQSISSGLDGGDSPSRCDAFL